MTSQAENTSFSLTKSVAGEQSKPQTGFARYGMSSSSEFLSVADELKQSTRAG